MKPKKIEQRARKGKPIRQIGALPFRRTPSGRLRFLLVTTRTTQRFVFPKGWPMRGRPNWKAAAIEAEEEAGVKGNVTREPIGTYRYWKRLQSAFVPISVTVFAIEVTEELDEFRETGERHQDWVSWKQARALIDEPELISLLDGFIANAASQGP